MAAITLRGTAIDENAVQYYKSAQHLFLPAQELEEINGFQLTLNKHRYLFCGGEPPLNSSCSARVAHHKYCANQLLHMADVPVPNSVMLLEEEFEDGRFIQQIERLKFPLVVKPVQARLGTDVLCNIQTFSELKTALANAFTSYNALLVQEFHGNLTSYRVLVFNQRVIGLVLRHPATVTGDGTNTIRELVELENKSREQINVYLGPIILDTEAQIRLKELGITESYVPVSGERVVLCYTSNATRGGSFGTLSTKKICKENRKLMLHITKTLNLKLAGIDIQCADISTPIKNSQGVIVEVNEVPSVRIHELPMWGHPQRVTRTIMRYFIYRHPFAYLYSLYRNKQTAFYVKGFIATLIVVSIYLLFFQGVI